MTPPVAPYVCAVCRAPVVAGSRFCAQCGTPFSERPPLRVAPPAVSPSTPGAAIPPPPRVPVVPPPPSYGPPPHAPVVTGYAPPPEKSNALLWVLGIVVLFVAALVGAYVLFAEPVDRDADGREVVDDAPAGPRETLPPVSADEGLDDGSFPTDDEIGAMGDEGLDDGFMDEGETDEPVDGGVIEELPEEEPAPAPPPRDPEPAPDPRASADSPQLATTWRTYQGSLVQYRQAVRRAGSSDKSQAEVAAACTDLFDAGNAVLRLPGRERYAGQITRDRRDC